MLRMKRVNAHADALSTLTKPTPLTECTHIEMSGRKGRRHRTKRKPTRPRLPLWALSRAESSFPFCAHFVINFVSHLRHNY
jgi:hypothetical protein